MIRHAETEDPEEIHGVARSTSRKTRKEQLLPKTGKEKETDEIFRF